MDSPRRVLVSISERIRSVDPLAVLENLHRDSSLVQLASLGCAYWARPSEGFAIAAFGAATVLSPAGPERFATVDREWASLLRESQIDGVAETRGVGPILIGGFSFDAGGPHTSRWEGFPAAHMIVPRVHVTTSSDGSWLTVTRLADAPGPTDEALRNAVREAASSGTARNGNGSLGLKVVVDLPDGQWRSIVSDAVSVIRSGDVKKIVLARSVSGAASHAIDPFDVLRRLESSQPDAFIYGYWRGDKVFAGASPERLAKLEGRTILASSLAGTVRRGATPEDDAALADQLRRSSKDIAEHAAVRDMLHDVLSDVSDNVTSSDEPEVMRLSNVFHLHTEVKAELRNGSSLLDVVDLLHPTPAVGGSPRDAALEFIDEREELDRGWYAGPIGWVGAKDGEFAVALRSGVISGSGFSLFAGCGIVAGSDPELELTESELKLQPMKSAIAESA